MRDNLRSFLNNNKTKPLKTRFLQQLLLNTNDDRNITVLSRQVMEQTTSVSCFLGMRRERGKHLGITTTAF